MLCKKCGNEINDNLKFCPFCGQLNELVMVTSNTMQQNNINNNLQGVSNINTYNNDNIQSNNYVPINNVPQNSVPPAPMSNNNKGNGLLFLIIGIVIVAIIFGFIIIGSMINKNNDEINNSNSNVTSNSNSNITSNSNSNITSNSNSNITSNSNSNITSNSNSNITSNSNSNITSNPNSNGTSNSNVSTAVTPITFNGFVLQIPKKYNASIEGNQLQLLGTNYKDVIIIGIQDGNFESIKRSKSTIETYMKNSGYNVYNTQVKTYNGIEFITAEVSQQGKQLLIGYAKLAPNYIFMVVSANTSYTIDYSKLSEMAEIVKTAKKVA